MKCDVCGTEKGMVNYGDAYTVICKNCYGTEAANRLLEESKARIQQKIDTSKEVMETEVVIDRKLLSVLKIISYLRIIWLNLLL